MKNKYFDIFQVCENDMEKVIGTALSTGGDYADLYFEYTDYFNLILRDGIVSNGGFHSDYGVGIRVLKGERTGYSYCENTDLKEMTKAAKAAAVIALSEQQSRSYCRVKNEANNFYPVLKPWRDTDASAVLPYLQNIEKLVRCKDERVAKVVAMISNSTSDVMMYNSLGELTYETRPMGSFVVSVVYEKNGRTETKSASRSFRCGFELLGEKIMEELAAEVTCGVDALFNASRPKGGQMPVVMADHRGSLWSLCLRRDRKALLQMLLLLHPLDKGPDDSLKQQNE